MPNKRKIKYADSKKVREIAEKIFKKYEKTFRRLARYEQQERDKYCEE